MYRFHGDAIPFEPVPPVDLPFPMRQAAATLQEEFPAAGETWWCMSGRRLPQWLQALIEIGEPQIITAIEQITVRSTQPAVATDGNGQSDMEVTFLPVSATPGFYVAYSHSFQCFFGVLAKTDTGYAGAERRFVRNGIR